MNLAGVMVADDTVAVDEVERGPVTVVEGVPNGPVVVDGNGVGQVVFGDLGPNVFDFVLTLELGSVDADQVHVGIGIALVEIPQRGIRANAVDSAVGPEIDDDDFALEFLH